VVDALDARTSIDATLCWFGGNADRIAGLTQQQNKSIEDIEVYLQLNRLSSD